MEAAGPLGAVADQESQHQNDHLVPLLDHQRSERIRSEDDALRVHAAARPARKVPRFRLAAPGRMPSSGLSRDGSTRYTDEVFNAASHFAAMMLSLLAGALTISSAAAKEYSGLPWKLAGLSVYFASLVLMFLCSSLHHAIEGPPELERALQAADYAAIYPLIAGTFTPFCLTFLHGTTQGWAFFGALWLLAVSGSTLTLLAFDHLPKYVPFTMYITMGWMGAFFVPFLWPYVGFPGVALLACGGICYTAGGAIFTLERPNPYPGVFGFHEIWHLLVVAGAASHLALIYAYVLPFQGSPSPS